MGPLTGMRIVEMGGIGPGPYAGMLLADLGADVVRVERKGDGPGMLPMQTKHNILARNKRSLALDLKDPDDIERALKLVETADGLIEGFRPGVMEKLGLGPEQCLARNPRLAYGRMTGWGQDGPWAATAGHDITYIALSGALHPIGRKNGPPAIPLNMVGDFGGGSLFLVMGLLSAIWSAERSGKGQVVDAAMVDGAASLMSVFYGMAAAGLWRPTRQGNLLDGGAPFYDVYECSDGQYMAVGALEPQFFAEFIRLLGLEGHPDMPRQMDLKRWPDMRKILAEAFLSKTRGEWADVFDGSDACVAPVLSYEEAHAHPHMAARGTFIEVAGVRQPGPAPRFSATPTGTPQAPQVPGGQEADIIRDWGLEEVWGPDEGTDA